VRVTSLASADDERFASGERRFTPASAAVGALVDLAPGWQLTGNLGYTQRAPKDYELFANGAHVATGVWETGDPTLGTEKSTSIDLGTQWQDGPQRFAVTAFASRYASYIGLMPTGTTKGDADLPEYAYTGVKARFVGLEASATTRLLGAQGLAGRAGASVLDLDLRADLVRATNVSTGEPLPLIAPARLGATLRWAMGAWARASASITRWRSTACPRAAARLAPTRSGTPRSPTARRSAAPSCSGMCAWTT